MFDITLNGNILTFSENVEKFDYSDIDVFLRTVAQSLSSLNKVKPTAKRKLHCGTIC
jgi:hypothetical protein